MSVIYPVIKPVISSSTGISARGGGGGGGPGPSWDLDALDYISRVEAKDGQALEEAVRLAYNAFFVALKQPGTAPIAAHAWEALTSGTALLMCGARTLSGALVPLHPSMPAPTNVNFVSGDYNRRAGLSPAGTKKINTNLMPAALPDTDASLGFMATASIVLTAPYQTILGMEVGASNRCRISTTGAAPSGPQIQIAGATHNAATASSGFYGAAVSGSTASAKTPSANIAIGAAVAGIADHIYPFGIFDRDGPAVGGTPSRTPGCWAHFGRAVDLASMDAALTTLMVALAAAIP